MPENGALEGKIKVPVEGTFIPHKISLRSSYRRITVEFVGDSLQDVPRINSGSSETAEPYGICHSDDGVFIKRLWKNLFFVDILL